MSGLSFMVTITSREWIPEVISYLREHRVEVHLVTMGEGTATNDMLDFFGLESREKAVAFSVVTDSVWQTLKKGLKRDMRFDVPGTGIVFTVPMSSIGGRRELMFLTENQGFEPGEGSVLTHTEQELLVVIANLGYSNLIMDAARDAGATGGTLIHAKGTGMDRAVQFMGVTLASEKEMIFIVSKQKDKKAIMESIMKKAGMGTKAKAMVISLPVTDALGMRNWEDD